MAKKQQTNLITQGSYPHHFSGFINPPIAHASTILFPDLESFLSRDNPYGGYALEGTPTSRALEDAWNKLEGAAGTVITPSGLSAISCALSSIIAAGDELLISDSVYNPTRVFCDKLLKRLNVKTTYYDPEIGSAIEDLITNKTKVIFLESPGSNTMEVQDVPAITAIAKARNIVTIIDNTWAGPLLFKPLAHGVDISITAATKYVLGHSDCIMGLVSASSPTWPLVKQYHTITGLTTGVDDQYMALRGLRTMAVRMKQHERGAFAIAKWLELQPQVEKVLFPGLPGHKNHDIWLRDFSGAGGLFSFITKPCSRARLKDFFTELQLFGIGFSWGGFKSMAIVCDQSKRLEQKKWHLDDRHLIRIYIGSEMIPDREIKLLTHGQSAD